MKVKKKTVKMSQYDLSIVYDNLTDKIGKVKKGLNFTDFKKEIQNIYKKPIPSNKLFWSSESVLATLYKEAYL